MIILLYYVVRTVRTYVYVRMQRTSSSISESERYIGVLYANNHYCVVEFLIQSKIIIITDGLCFSWLNVVKRIIENDMPSVNNNNILIGYHSKKKEDLLPRLLQLNIIEWWKSGSIPKDRAWLLVHSSDFNFLKERLEDYEASMMNDDSVKDTF